MTRFEGNQIADLLYAASEDAPPSRVSLQAVLADGRRRRRRRAVAVPLLIAATVAGLAAAAVAAATLRPAATPTLPPATVSPTPGPTDPVAPSEFPLDRIRTGIGLLGEPSSVTLAPGVQFLRYGDIEVWTYAAAADELRARIETEHASAPAGGAEAPPVNGRPAHYLYTDDGGALRLFGIAFQWAPGAWADIFAPAATETRLHDLAASLRTDIDEPARFWFTVSQPPNAWWAMSVPVSTGDEGRYSSILFTPDDGLQAPTLIRGIDSYIEVSYGEYFDGVPEQNATIGGRPARVSDGVDSYSVELFEVDGSAVKAVNVSVWGTARDLFGPDEAQALALSVVVAGTWDDRSQWTEDPIR